jgi:hypothetical protein
LLWGHGRQSAAAAPRRIATAGTGGHGRMDPITDCEIPEFLN